MDWETFVIILAICVVIAELGFLVFDFVSYVTAHKKPKGDKLKRARERRYKRVIKHNIKIIKSFYIDNKVWVECSVPCGMGERCRADIEKWLKENNILYKFEDTGLSYVIGIKFLE